MTQNTIAGEELMHRRHRPVHVNIFPAKKRDEDDTPNRDPKTSIGKNLPPTAERVIPLEVVPVNPPCKRFLCPRSSHCRLAFALFGRANGSINSMGEQAARV
jgi:hypothetical protein